MVKRREGDQAGVEVTTELRKDSEAEEKVEARNAAEALEEKEGKIEIEEI